VGAQVIHNLGPKRRIRSPPRVDVRNRDKVGFGRVLIIRTHYIAGQENLKTTGLEGSGLVHKKVLEFLVTRGGI